MNGNAPVLLFLAFFNFACKPEDYDEDQDGNSSEGGSDVSEDWVQQQCSGKKLSGDDIHEALRKHPMCVEDPDKPGILGPRDLLVSLFAASSHIFEHSYDVGTASAYMHIERNDKGNVTRVELNNRAEGSICNAARKQPKQPINDENLARRSHACMRVGRVNRELRSRRLTAKGCPARTVVSRSPMRSIGG